MRFHEELNPKLFNGLELKPEVKEKLNEIAEAFKEYLDIPEDAILDERITGSSASYNYTEYSDLDLHLIIDYEKVHEDCPLVEGYLWSYKSQFNANHDISIYGIPVEVYAEDSKQEAISNGVYSLMEDKWLKEPKKIPPTDNDEDVQAKYQELKDAIDKCDDSEVANELLDKIYTMRKSGLAEVGEFSTENMAFKLLRNDGSIDKLKKLKKEKVDKQLSLESYNEEMYIDEKDVPPLHDYAIIFKYQEPWPDGKLAYRAIMKLTTGSSYRMQSWSYTKEGMINIVKKQWPYADIVDKTNEPVSESYNQPTSKELKDALKERAEKIAAKQGWTVKSIENLGEDDEYYRERNKLESMKESLKDEYKQAFDLLIKGENIVSTLDTDFGKQLVKDVESLYEIKSLKLKLRKAKELLRDIQGYLVDEQYDDYNAEIDKFINNSKNESIKEGFNKGDKVQLKRKNNKIGIVKSIFNGDKDKNGKDIKYLDVEFEDGKNNGAYPSQYFRKITEALNTNILKELSENSKKSTNETTMLLNKLNKAINEALEQDYDKVSAQDIRRWFESKTKYKKQKDSEFYVRSAVKQFPQLKGKEEELRKNIEKQKAKNKPWYPYMDAVKDTLKDINAFQECINEALEDELQVGDTVVLRGSQPLQLKRRGTIKKLNNETAVVEFPEVPEQDLMTREDTYYIDELQKVNESVDEEKQVLDAFKSVKNSFFNNDNIYITAESLYDLIMDKYPLPYTKDEFINILQKSGVNFYTIDQSDINEFIENYEETLQDYGISIEEVQDLNGLTYYGSVDAETVMLDILEM